MKSQQALARLFLQLLPLGLQMNAMKVKTAVAFGDLAEGKLQDAKLKSHFMMWMCLMCRGGQYCNAHYPEG